MEISDSPAYQAYLRTRAAFTRDAGVRALETWREISAGTWRLARLNTESYFHTVHQLLRSPDALQPAVIFAQQLPPAFQRTIAWQERVLDLLGGAQAEVAAMAEAYVPAARYAAAPLAD